mmetsp:Transcript_24437/g.78829  ORF Transcript_24437/g.78829 Transcript_24437/m.78829 type:complete len:271 (-) Transcript_24437:1738-2550(-)
MSVPYADASIRLMGAGAVAGTASHRAPLRYPATAMAAPVSSVSVSSSFDSGNARLVFAEGDLVTVRIEADPVTELEGCRHLQWFAFRSTLTTVAVGGTPSASDERLILYEIDNAGLCLYASAWDGAEVCVSHDRQSWCRVPTTRYDVADGTLRWEWRHTPLQPTAYFAYFDTYPYERHLDFVAQCMTANAPGLRVSSLGRSLDGRDIDYITVGSGPLQAWVVHRQHPGEPQRPPSLLRGCSAGCSVWARPGEWMGWRPRCFRPSRGTWFP